MTKQQRSVTKKDCYRFYHLRTCWRGKRNSECLFVNNKKTKSTFCLWVSVPGPLSLYSCLLIPVSLSLSPYRDQVPLGKDLYFGWMFCCSFLSRWIVEFVFVCFISFIHVSARIRDTKDKIYTLCITSQLWLICFIF